MEQTLHEGAEAVKVLVTGAAGFVAPHVMRALHQHGLYVIAHDIRMAPDSEADEYVQGDLTDLGHLTSKLSGVDVVLHLGGVGDVYLAKEKPYLAASANVVGTAMVAEAAARAGVAKLIYASTWEVYGAPEYTPIDEEHPCRPAHPYNITKLAGEQLALSYGRSKRLSVVSLRLGTAYGPGMRANSVFSMFAARAIKGMPIEIHGTGEQSRQFTHVRDIAHAFCLAMESGHGHEVFNIVSPESVSIARLAEITSNRWPTEVRYGAARDGDIVFAPVSSEKARDVLGWRADVTFDLGMQELLDDYGAFAASATR